MKTSKALDFFGGSENITRKFLIQAGIYFSFWSIVHVKNIFVDFVDDRTKLFTAITGAFIFFQAIIFMKTVSFCTRLDSVKVLKAKILQDAAKTTKEEMKIERRYRKFTRVLIVATASIYFFTIVLALMWELIFIRQMVMMIRMQMPWTLPDEHPSHEINLFMMFSWQVVTLIVLVGYESFFYLVTFHCVAKMSVCCFDAMKIDGKTDEKSISDLVNKHLHVLELIEISAKIFNPICFHQLFTTFGLLCEKFQESLYCSKWYEIESVKSKKKILFMLMMAQRRKEYSVLGVKPLNLQTYADVVKQAYTFLNILLGAL
ncbi:CLUMA_CG010584, isoform A [Clunio marinus]|uniref:CLUMA_CG010584, isoform A n=1 Tax=Clunio marinus TaxID=568069 RepID=A0A1J1IAE6_9DIPT|nr:CLUMA_CG010584, isoform A [Clunio marinus]